MGEMMNNIAKRMITKIQVVNLYTKDWAQDERRFTESRKRNKFDFELSGMFQTLEAAGISYDVEYNDDVSEITAIIIMGTRYSVN